ncbi:hypothetical protein GCM10007140_23530 [Priestia taiwanensis]|uniref:Uncharacterized protein n=1 Tax=Priestia taiwanensis TaxID=1347902 RepID=A0A917EPV4_9BACI|nr:hypothetical protein GCM10007140_23530 [Priestia taiwanensis]
MNNITGIYITLCIMQFVVLLNITVFNSEFNGITMMINSILFLVGTIFYASSRQRKNIN